MAKTTWKICGNLDMFVYCEAKLLLCEPHIVIYTIIMKVYGKSICIRSACLSLMC